MDRRIQEMYEEEQQARPRLAGESQLDAKELNKIMMAGENSEGLFTPEPEVDENNELKETNLPVDEEVEMQTGKIQEKFGDYIKAFQDDMITNPDRYTIETPEGRMSIQEALQQGYDPATQTFQAAPASASIDEELAGLPPEEQEAIRAMTNPNRANETPPGMEAMVPPGAGGPEGQPLPEEGLPQEAPGILGALGGGQ